MAKKHAKSRKRSKTLTKLTSSILGHSKKLLKQALDNKLSLLTLAVVIFNTYQMAQLQALLSDLSSTILAASMSAFTNTMVMFSAVSSELESLLSLFVGTGS